MVEALRAGEVASQSFEKVIVVGHSIGSFVAVNYAGSFPGEADGIVLTGFLHDINVDFINNVLLPATYPATLDPKFAGQFPNFDYFTTVPGARGGAFYQLSHVDPRVLELDESLKQTLTLGEINTGTPIVFDPISMQIEGPVLVVIGEFDPLFCGNLVSCSNKAAVQDYEEGFYGDSACIETTVTNTSGHSLNLHINAQTAYNRMLSWANRRIGRTIDAASQPCNAP